MSDLIWKHKHKDDTVLPTEKAQRNKLYRCRRRIMKQMLRYPNKYTKTDSFKQLVFASFDIKRRAEDERIKRVRDKEEKVKYYLSGNRHLPELKQEPHIKPVKPVTSTMMMNDCGIWQTITAYN